VRQKQNTLLVIAADNKRFRNFSAWKLRWNHDWCSQLQLYKADRQERAINFFTNSSFV